MAAAQQTTDEAYMRSSMSVLLVSRPYGNKGSYDAQIQKYFATLNLSSKYDINPLSSKILDMSSAGSTTSGAIEQKLNSLNVGKEVISYWFNRQPSGSMDMSQIWKRGMYNATDQNYLQAVATKRGVDELKDAGLNLVKRSYVVVLDVSNVTLQQMPNTSICYFTGFVNTHLYALSYNEHMQNAIFDCWIDESTQVYELSKKRAEFNNLSFNVKHVRTISTNVSSLDAGRGMASAFLAVANKNQNNSSCGSSDDELRKFTADTYRQALQSLEEKQADLKVKTPIVSTCPIKAKIGEKEGVHRSQLFQISEYRADKYGNPKKHRVAYVRATGVADNRYVADGSMATSKFTPISSRRRIRKGMDITQKNDHRMEYYLDYVGADNIMNVSTGLEYINFYLTGGFSGRMLFDLSFCGFDATPKAGADEFLFAFRLGYNLGFNIFPNLSVHGFASVGLGFSSSGSVPETSSSSSGEEPSIADYINEYPISYGATVNLSYFYPVTLYFKMETIGLLTGGDEYLYPMALGGGIKIAF